MKGCTGGTAIIFNYFFNYSLVPCAFALIERSIAISLEYARHFRSEYFAARQVAENVNNVSRGTTRLHVNHPACWVSDYA